MTTMPAVSTPLKSRLYAALYALEHLPLWPVLLLARVSIAVVFWNSGQTKIEGLVLDPLNLHAEWGWPHLADGTVDLFRDEYRLPLIPPLWAALAAATAEHVLSLMLALGLGTRLAATGLLGMTAVIQTLVYPGAWPTHGTWAALLLLLILRGPGPVSVDHLMTGWARSHRH
jgi:putative oxidoreductase